MIQISETAQAHFRRLIEREAIPGLGVRLSALNPGTRRADVRLEFAESDELNGDEWVIDCAGFTLWLDAASAPFLDGAQIDYETNPTGGQLQIRAPKIKGAAPPPDAPLAERVQWVIDNDINPQLAMHKGSVALAGADDGVVLLNFGGGCHGCSMVDITLKQGVEKTLLAQVTGVRQVIDVTDHDSGTNPYASRSGKNAPADGSPYGKA